MEGFINEIFFIGENNEVIRVPNIHTLEIAWDSVKVVGFTGSYEQVIGRVTDSEIRILMQGKLGGINKPIEGVSGQLVKGDFTIPQQSNIVVKGFLPCISLKYCNTRAVVSLGIQKYVVDEELLEKRLNMNGLYNYYLLGNNYFNYSNSKDSNLLFFNCISNAYKWYKCLPQNNRLVPLEKIYRYLYNMYFFLDVADTLAFSRRHKEILGKSLKYLKYLLDKANKSPEKSISSSIVYYIKLSRCIKTLVNSEDIIDLGNRFSRSIK